MMILKPLSITILYFRDIKDYSSKILLLFIGKTPNQHTQVIPTGCLAEPFIDRSKDFLISGAEL
jgi:hypothetical protein